MEEGAWSTGQVQRVGVRRATDGSHSDDVVPGKPEAPTGRRDVDPEEVKIARERRVLDRVDAHLQREWKCAQVRWGRGDRLGQTMFSPNRLISAKRGGGRVPETTHGSRAKAPSTRPAKPCLE